MVTWRNPLTRRIRGTEMRQRGMIVNDPPWILAIITSTWNDEEMDSFYDAERKKAKGLDWDELAKVLPGGLYLGCMLSFDELIRRMFVDRGNIAGDRDLEDVESDSSTLFEGGVRTPQDSGDEGEEGGGGDEKPKGREKSGKSKKEKKVKKSNKKKYSQHLPRLLTETIDLSQETATTIAPEEPPRPEPPSAPRLPTIIIDSPQ